MTPPSLDAAAHKQVRSLVRSLVYSVIAVVVVLYGGAALVWFAAYLGGTCVVGTTDQEAGIAIARRLNPELTGLTWTKRQTTAEEQRRAHVVQERRFFGLVETWTEGGTAEMIGTCDGRERVRVAVAPGPLGIGWKLTRISYPPPR